MKRKLELKKTVIASLSDAQKARIIGGDDGGGGAYTTSNTDCTHFLCCGDTCSVEKTHCGGTCEGTCEGDPTCHGNTCCNSCNPVQCGGSVGTVCTI